MNEKIIDIYDFKNFEDEDFNEAFSDLCFFGVNNDESNLNFYDIENLEN